TRHVTCALAFQLELGRFDPCFNEWLQLRFRPAHSAGSSTKQVWRSIALRNRVGEGLGKSRFELRNRNHAVIMRSRPNRCCHTVNKGKKVRGIKRACEQFANNFMVTVLNAGHFERSLSKT